MISSPEFRSSTNKWQSPLTRLTSQIGMRECYPSGGVKVIAHGWVNSKFVTLLWRCLFDGMVRASSLDIVFANSHAVFGYSSSLGAWLTLHYSVCCSSWNAFMLHIACLLDSFLPVLYYTCLFFALLCLCSHEMLYYLSTIARLHSYLSKWHINQSNPT